MKKETCHAKDTYTGSGCRPSGSDFGGVSHRSELHRGVLLAENVIVSRNSADYPPQQISTLQENSTFGLIGRVVGQPTFRRF
jgi:hypothetical protein